MRPYERLFNDASLHSHLDAGIFHHTPSRFMKIHSNQPELIFQSSSNPIETIDNYTGNNPRLTMFQLITESTRACQHICPNPTTEIMHTSQSLFEEFRRDGSLSEKTRLLLRPSIEKLKESSPTNRLAVRRAFFDKSTGQKLDGPTLNAISDTEEIIQNIEIMFGAAIERGYTERDNVEISVFIQQWEDPSVVEDLGKLKSMPIGGDVITEKINSNGSIDLRIQAVLGDNAAITQVEKANIDTYRVRYYPGNSIAPHVEILHESTDIKPQKSHCYLQRTKQPTKNATMLTETNSHSNKDSHWWLVEVDHTTNLTTPLLDDHELERIGHIAGHIVKNHGPKKFEFSLSQRIDPYTHQHFMAPIFNEVEDWEIQESSLGLPKLITEGSLSAVINDLDDVMEFSKKIQSLGSEKPIIILTTECIQNWIKDSQISAAIADLPKSCNILAPTRDTEHHAGKLREAGHNVIPIQSYTDYSVGDYLRIMARNNSNYIELGERGENQSLPALLTVRDALARGLRAPEEVGGKIVGTISAKAAGFLIPDNTSFTTRTFFDEVIDLNGLKQNLVMLSEARSKIQVKNYFSAIESKLTKLPEETLRQIYSGLVAIHGTSGKLAIRSNLSIEDRRGARFPGVFGTELGVSLETFENFEEKCLSVMRSYFSQNAAESVYSSLSPNTRIKVLNDLMCSLEFQPMIEAVASGTLFGKEDGEYGRNDVIVIEAGYGVASIVDGNHGKDALRIVFNKTFRQFESIVLTKNREEVHIDEKDLSPITSIIGATQAHNLIDLARLITTKFGTAQDVEWALTADGYIYILQARPI